MRLAASAVLALAFAAPAAGGDYRNPTAGSMVALQIPGMHLAKVQRNLPYGRGERMDVYRPRDAKGRLPAVLFVHGSARGASPKEHGSFVGWGQLAAASGLVGVTFNHRDDPADVVAAVRYVRANAARLGIDGRRLCVHGFSAGVQVGMLAVLKGSAGSIACAVGYFGPLDAELEQLSPLPYLKKSSPPTLVVKAGRDSPAINRSIDRFVAKAKAVGAQVELQVHANAGHGLGDDARTRAIMKRTLAFLRAHLLRAG